jgi:minor histocompatibility antigen H13
MESMTHQDAMKFPFIGSAVLVSLYLAFKFLPKELLNNLLSAYFLFFGVFAMAWTLRPIVLLPLSSANRRWLAQKRRPLKLWPAFVFGDEPMELDPADFVCLAIAVAAGVWYWFSKHWILSNLLGVAFSVQGIAMLNLGSYKTGCILLSGLFFYDIWWVFYTDVMVTVAKSFDVPIKLTFPRNLWTTGTMEFSMLGLGDIVIPGIFVALLLRLDAHVARTRARKSENDPLPPIPRSFPTPFFNWVYAGYVIGLVSTIVVMHVFKAAQPALLYLVPSCIGSSLLCGLVRGELSLLWNYSEEDTDADKEAEKAADAKSD